MRVFIDCDDTLVIWHEASEQDPGFNERISTDWHFNAQLAELIVAWNSLSQPMIIWSGGGMDYALMWLHRLERFTGQRLDVVKTGVYKEPGLSCDGDLLLDDTSMEKFKGLVIDAGRWDPERW